MIVVSNENGLFEIKNLSNNNTLIVSYIGYKSQSITIDNSTELSCPAKIPLVFATDWAWRNR